MSKKYLKKQKQLCETCDMSVFKKCRWAHLFEPIKGWKAKKVRVRMERGRYTDTYVISKCPNYVKEGKREKQDTRLAPPEKPKLYCVVCGKEIKERGRKRYCSQQCHNESQKRKNREYYLSKKKRLDSKN